MELVGELNAARKEVLADIWKCLGRVREIAANDSAGISEGIKVLLALRNETYEDINQIQHEAMILRAIDDLEAKEFAGQDIEWHWNPRQRGAKNEPDLRGMVGGKVVASAEITTSEKPVGAIDKRMAGTLKNLAAMPGQRFYFVRTEAMRKRAETKVEKAGYSAAVRIA